MGSRLILGHLPPFTGNARTLLHLLACLLLLGCTAQLSAQAAEPVLFYSDLDSGPATGGQGGNGAFVCVYGENFGASGTMMIGGAAASVVRWMDPGAPYVPAHYAKACGQIASTAATGAGIIQLTTSAGTSNILPFTIRAGNIYFVSGSGSDSSGDGSYADPWETITHCKNTFAPGDICVAGISSSDAIMVTTAEPQNWGTVVGLLLNSCGSAGNPKTIIAYPGNSVTYDLHTWIDPSANQKGGGRALEDYNSPSYANNCGTGNRISYWTIGGLTLNGNSFAADFNGAEFRVVDNTLQCTGAYCDGPSGGLVGGTGGNLVLYGNRINKPGCGGANTPCASGMSNTSKLYHTVYLGEGNNQTLAYNEVIGGTACRGMQFHSPDSGGNPQQNIQIYNNVIHDTQCDGLNLATVNPSAPGGVNVYNNLVYNAGIGPNPHDGIAHYSCFYSPAYTGNGTCRGGGSGTINVFNNTFYNCGGQGLTDPGAIGALNCAPVTVALNNNLIDQPVSGVPFLSAGSSGTITATSNDCFGYSTGSGAAGCPALWGGTEWSFDPAFVNVASHDFHLSAASQAAASSVTAPVPATDADGLIRLSPNSLGAYEPANSQASNPAGSGLPPQLTVNCAPVTYDGNPHSCTGSAIGNSGAPVSGSWSFIPASETSAGYYAVTGIFASIDPTYGGGLVSSILSIAKAVPTVAFTGAPASAPYHASFTVAASSNASTTAVVTESGVCKVAGNTVTMTGPSGSCSLNANWAADSNYLSASAAQTTNATAATPAITWAVPAAIPYGTALGGAQLNARATYNGSTVGGSFAYSPAAGTVLGAGPQTLSAIFTPTNSADYAPARASVTLQVNPAASRISWAAPAAISYGTALSRTQLNATASVRGDFTYAPAAGTVLAAGSQALSTTFVPTDTTDRKSATATVSITVNKAAPRISWVAPAAISYSTALGGTQLNATAAVPGSFAYSPAAGKVLAGGSQTLWVTFTPTDSRDYKAVSASVTLQVNPSLPVITWATPAAITYGTALGSAQLKAKATFNGVTVAGSFAYSPAAGKVLGAGPQTLSAIFTPASSADYSSVSAAAAVQVDMATPKLSWAQPAAITYGTALGSAQLRATAAVPGSFAYLPAAATVLTPGIQTLSVVFTPNDTTDYTTLTATTTITVDKAPTTSAITSTAPSTAQPDQAVRVSFTVTGAGLPTGNVTVKASSGETCTAALGAGVGSCPLMFSRSGTRTLIASYVGDTNFKSSSSFEVTEVVQP